MKFTLSSADFLRALNTVSSVVPSKSTQPILECILFEQTNNKLRISAKDDELSITQDLEAQFESNGTGATSRIAVPAKRILETLRALPDLPITFTSNADFQIELTTDQGHYEMAGYDGSDYPSIDLALEGATIHTTGTVLKRTHQKTSFAVSKDALRPAMMGVYFKIDADKGTAVATDGHRLVEYVISSLSSDEPLSFILPEKALSIVSKVATEDACSVTISDNAVTFNFSDTIIVARIISEKYPNYEAVIPRDNQKRLVINREALLAAVKRVGLYSSSMTHQIRLNITENNVTISAEDIERSSRAKESILCEYDSEAMEIGFNAVYLTEVLNNADDADVLFNLSSPNRAGIVTPIEQASDEALLMLIMPVMLNTYA